jgi:hypothetical protein
MTGEGRSHEHPRTARQAHTAERVYLDAHLRSAVPRRAGERLAQQLRREDARAAAGGASERRRARI